MATATLDFTDAVIPPDTVPETTDVEYPCRVCGREAGPYGGRGPKPKYCPDHKKGNSTSNTRSAKVTGSAQTLAAQATGVLVQLNSLMAVGAMAMGLTGTATAIFEANPNFEEQAYQALLTDPEFCKFLLKGGAKSAKVSLGIAYFGMGAMVVPTAVNEMREKKAARELLREEAENATGT